MARRTVWVDNLLDLTIANGAQDSQSLLTGTSPIDMCGTTIVRHVFDIGLFSTTVAGAWGVQLVDIAVGITS